MKFKGWKTRGELRTYDCRIKESALDGPRIRVYEMQPKRFLFFRWLGWKRVWTTGEFYNGLNTPSKIKEAAVAAVRAYEHWKLEWEAEHTKQRWGEDTQ